MKIRIPLVLIIPLFDWIATFHCIGSGKTVMHNIVQTGRSTLLSVLLPACEIGGSSVFCEHDLRVRLVRVKRGDSIPPKCSELGDFADYFITSERKRVSVDHIDVLKSWANCPVFMIIKVL